MPLWKQKKIQECCINIIDNSDDEEFINPDNIPQNYRKLKRDSRIKQCLHPNKDLCSEKIIKAHSIQNNKILKSIASNGKVYMPWTKSDNPFVVVTECGRKEATTFTGFCGYHDKSVFQSIEDTLFDKSLEHIFLYTYRCFAIEYHKKQEMVKMGQQILFKKPSLLNLSKEDNPFGGMHLAVNDLDPVKQQFDKALLDKNYEILSSVVWEFDHKVNFAGTGFEAMTRDLMGNKIQDLLKLDVLAKHIFVMVFPEEDKYCIISWLNENDELFSEYHKKLLELNEKQKKSYINNLLPMISKNIAINPDAWERWEDYKKDKFGSLIWGMETLAELSDMVWNRLEPRVYDLFDI